MLDSPCPDVVYNCQTVTLGNTRAVACSMDDANHWHVWVPRPGMANLGCENLERQGFRTLQPRVITKVFHSGKPVLVTADMFPGYRFVQFEDTDPRWPKVHFTLGVRRLLMSPSLRPVTVPVQEMSRLLEYPTVYDENVDADPTILGSTVEVLDGAFSTMRGVVLQSAKGRVSVLLSLFGQSTKVNMALTSVIRQNG